MSMKVFVCKFRNREHAATAVVLAFNRGHAVKLLNKRLEDSGRESLGKDVPLDLRELDPEDPVHKKGHVELSWSD